MTDSDSAAAFIHISAAMREADKIRTELEKVHKQYGSALDRVVDAISGSERRGQISSIEDIRAWFDNESEPLRHVAAHVWKRL